MDRQKVRAAIADAKGHLAYATQLKDGDPTRAALDAQIATASALVAIADLLLELSADRQPDGG